MRLERQAVKELRAAAKHHDPQGILKGAVERIGDSLLRAAKHHDPQGILKVELLVQLSAPDLYAAKHHDPQGILKVLDNGIRLATDAPAAKHHDPQGILKVPRRVGCDGWVCAAKHHDPQGILKGRVVGYCVCSDWMPRSTTIRRGY